MLDECLYFLIMFMHLKQFKFFDDGKIKLVGTFVNHFVDGLLVLNELFFELGFVEFEFALIESFHLFFKGGNEVFLF